VFDNRPSQLTQEQDETPQQRPERIVVESVKEFHQPRNHATKSRCTLSAATQTLISSNQARSLASATACMNPNNLGVKPSSAHSSSATSPVHISRDTSPFTDLPHPDALELDEYKKHSDQDDDDFAWDDNYDEDDDRGRMPLHCSHQRTSTATTLPLQAVLPSESVAHIYENATLM
jgi:hypothetical protein